MHVTSILMLKFTTQQYHSLFIIGVKPNRCHLMSPMALIDRCWYADAVNEHSILICICQLKCWRAVNSMRRSALKIKISNWNYSCADESLIMVTGWWRRQQPFHTVLSIDSLTHANETLWTKCVFFFFATFSNELKQKQYTSFSKQSCSIRIMIRNYYAVFLFELFAHFPYQPN